MKKLSAICAVAFATLFAGNAFALDTTEQLDYGVVEVAPTIGLANIHDGKPGWLSDISLGYGVADFMTIYTNFTMESEISLAPAYFGFDFDLLTTLYDSENFDVDFHVDFAYGITITPGFEFNYDSNNDMSGFGAYLKLDLPIYSAHFAAEDEVDEDGEVTKEEVRTDFDLALGIGLYYTIMEGNQLFAEGGLKVNQMAKKLADKRTVDGYIAVGYNVEIAENIELISEVRVDIPDEKDDTNATISVGMIFDIPTAK